MPEVPVQLVTPPWAGNPLYPLPPDYPSLTREGKRLARVNACRQWLLPGDDHPPTHTRREWLGLLLHHSLSFFDRYYLWPDGDFDPGFYPDPPRESAPFHADILESWASSRFSLAVCPRGSAKSTFARKDILLEIISDPKRSFVYATATHDLAKIAGDSIRNQCYENPRIHDDWAPTYGAPLKPVRGDRSSGVEHFFLTTGSQVQLRSVGSTQRGIRPHRYVLDDPEHDASGSTSMSQLVQDFDRMLFKIIMPMVLKSDSRIRWLATFVSKRHYAWKAMQGKETPSGYRSEDPRFDYWDRLQINIMEPDPATNQMVSCWPDMWPLTLEGPMTETGRVSVEQIRAFMGAEAFNSEMMGNPGDTGSTFFPPITDELHGFTLSDIDPIFETEPRRSGTLISWIRHRGLSSQPTRISMKLCDFLSQARLFMCLDWAPTHNPTSDFKTAILMAHLPTSNELFVLDGWSGRTPKDTQIREAFRIADHWKCPSLHPEVIKESIVLYNDMVDVVRTRALDIHGISWAPKIVALRPGMESKSEKISSLFLRVEHGLLKLPLWNRNQPWLLRLLDQLASFNPQVTDGGLAHDDELDTVSQSKFVLKGRQTTPHTPEASTDPVDHLISGKFSELDTPIAAGINWSLVTPAQLGKLLRPVLPSHNPGTRI